MPLDPTEALRRTKRMLVREWNLPTEPLSETSLRDKWPKGLGKNDLAVRALKPPIENAFFQDVGAQVRGADLIAAKTVGELRDKILNGIP